MGRLKYYANAWLPARDLLVSSVMTSKASVDPTGQILLFEQFLPWKVFFCSSLDSDLHLAVILFQEHLFELETDEKNTAIEANKAIYVVYPDETAGSWRVQAVPVSPESFESRKALPEAWRGLRDEELSRVSGIKGGIFIHASGFIGGKLYIYLNLTNLF